MVISQELRTISVAIYLAKFWFPFSTFMSILVLLAAEIWIQLPHQLVFSQLFFTIFNRSAITEQVCMTIKLKPLYIIGFK